QSANWADTVQLKGFMSTAYQKTDTKTSFNGEGLAGINEDGVFNGTKLGINLTIPINNKITVATQFLSILEGAENYNTHLDWAIISYKLTDELQFRAGKIKFPTGILNEYRDVANSYPWISTPVLFYSTEAIGPRNTSESYTGVSGLGEYYIEDTLISLDIFTGEVEAEEMYLRQLIGAKLFLNWDDTLNLQATYYQGEMVRMAGMVMTNSAIHSNYAFGMNLDWNNIIAYAEWAKTDTQDDTTSGTSWYTTLGYQIDDWLPHITYQSLERGIGSTDEHLQNMTTLGLRYDLFDNADVKFEYSYINTPTGAGLFEDETFNPTTDKNVNMFGVAFDLVF
ncbi:hypothetical protein JHD49_10490, partial [Sulfurimonas sp. SAG-AH-194-C21]